MVRALAPFRQHCAACNWRGRVITGHSDAMFISDFGSDIRATCPECGKGDLELEAVTELAARASRMINSFKRIITNKKWVSVFRD